MTSKERNKFCRIKAVKQTRFTVWLIQVILLLIALYIEVLNYKELILTFSSITLWIYGPCNIMRILESFYHIKGDEGSYK